MPIRIDSADYQNIQEPMVQHKKFDSLRYTIVGSADYVAAPVLATAWDYTLHISASASALGAGVSAGGLNSLRTSFLKTTALTFVTDEAVTATGWFRTLQISERLNPTEYLVRIGLVKAQ